MDRIVRTVVASGIIGRFNHDWYVEELYDNKCNNKRYNLYINKEYINCFPYVVEALNELVYRFIEVI